MKFILPIAFSLIYSILSAQHDFMPGYVVLQPGDTLKGWIDNIKPNLTFKLCKFRKNPKGEIVSYKADQIPAFGMYRGSHFQSFAGDSAKSFYEVFGRGKVSLLYQDHRYFAAKDSGNPIELKRIRKEVEVKKTSYTGEQDQSSTTFIKTDDRFRVTLRSMMNDCPTIEPAIVKADLTKKRMVKLAKTYNECVGSKYIDFGKEKPWLKLNYRVFFGAKRAHFSLLEKEYLYGAASFKTSNSFTGGIGIEFLSPRINDRLKFIIEPGYVEASFQGYHEQKGTLSIYRYNIFVNVQSVRIPIGVRINFKQEASTPYLKLGVSIDRLLNTSGHVVEEHESTLSGTVTSDTYPTEEFRKTQRGYWISAGFNKKIAKGLYSFIELRYAVVDGYFGNSVENHSNGNELAILTGLQF